MSFTKTLLLLSLSLFATAQIASAGAQARDITPVQAFRLKIRDPKVLKKFLKEYDVIQSGERYFIVGENAADGPRDAKLPVEIYQLMLPSKAKITKPLARAPYDYDKNGDRKLIKKYKKSLASVPMKYLDTVTEGNSVSVRSSAISDFGLYSLCVDLERRRQEVLGLVKALKKLKKVHSPDEWNTTRDQLVLSWEGLVSYVENFPLFEPMGPSLRAEFEKSLKKIRSMEKSARIEAYTASVKDAEIKEVELEAPDDMKFHSFESDHIRMVYLIGEDGITDSHAKRLALIAEQTIELFRSVAIDPYPEFVEEQEGDLPIIPNSVFQEYFIGPDSAEYQKALYLEYYGREAGDDRVFEAMLTAATLQNSREEPLFLAYSKCRPAALKSMVVHILGHSLSSLHYNQSDKRNVHDALPVVRESVARYLCFEKLGNNSMRCTNFQVATYANQKGGEDKDQVKLGDSFQQRFFKLSLTAPSMNDCAIVPLNKLNELHMAKGWMTYFYILTQDGLVGQKWLRACHDAVIKKGSGDRTGLDRNVWRESTKELFADRELPRDPLLIYEELIKKLAEETLEK